MSRRSSARASALALGLYLLLASCNDTARAPQLELVHAFALQENLSVVDISPSGRAVVFVARLGGSSVSVDPFTQLVSIGGASDQALAARFDGDERVVLVGAKGAVETFAVADGRPIEKRSYPFTQQVRRAAISRDGRYLGLDARVYDLRDERWSVEQPLPGSQTALGFARDRFVLTAGFHDKRVEVRGLGVNAARTLRVGAKVGAAAIDDDGRYVAAGTEEDIQLWELDGSEPTCRRSSGDLISGIAFGSGFVAAVGERRLHLLRVPNCEELASVRLEDRAITLAVEGSVIAAGDASGYVYVWATDPVRLLGRARLEHPITALSVDAASRRVLAAANHEHGAAAKLLRFGSL